MCSRNLLLLLFYNSFSLLNINAQNLTFQLILERIFGLFSPNCDELCRPRKLNDRVYSRFVQQHVLQYDTNLQSVTNYSKIKIKQWRLFISHFLSRFLSRHSEKKSLSFLHIVWQLVTDSVDTRRSCQIELDEIRRNTE